jgi:hypothetical protein
MRRLLVTTLCWALAVPLWAGATGAGTSPARPVASQLRADLERILARAEYRQAESQWPASLIYRLLRSASVWYQEHLAPFFAHLHEVSPVWYWAIVTLGGVALALLLYHIYVTVRSSFGPRSRARGQGSAMGADQVLQSPESLLRQADLAAGEGDFAEALRRLYLALIRNLDRHGLLRYDRSRTNYEYLRELSPNPHLSAPLHRLTRQAETVWYGGHSFAAEDYQRCRRLALEAWQGEAHTAAE